MEIAKNILTDFRSELMGRDVKNKTGFLAGIMRRYAKLNKIKVDRDEAQETDHHVDTYEPRMMADSNIVSDVAAEDIKVDILDGIDDDDDNEAVEVMHHYTTVLVRHCFSVFNIILILYF